MSAQIKLVNYKCQDINICVIKFLRQIEIIVLADLARDYSEMFSMCYELFIML